MVFKFAYFVEFTKGYQPGKFQCCRFSGSSFIKKRDYKNTVMTSLWRHFIFLGFKISIFCETDKKLSNCQVSNPSVT